MNARTPAAIKRRCLATALGVAIAAIGCAGPTAKPCPPPVAVIEGASVELSTTPFFPQEGFQCGPAALATVLAASGLPVTPADLRPQVFLPGRRGSLQMELLAASRRHGRLPYEISGGMSGLLAELRGGRPVLVLQNVGWERWPVWHYAVVVGALSEPDRVVLRSGRKERLVVPARKFVRSWQAGSFWGVVVLRPGQMPAQVDRRTYLKAAAALEAAGQAEAARAAYRAALGQWPGDPVARLGLGNSAFALGEWSEAETAYRALLADQPGLVIARNNLAQVLAEAGDLTAALAEIDTALAAEGVADGLRAALVETRREIIARAASGGSKTDARGVAP